MFGILFDIAENVSEDDIRDNMRYLKKQTWFQNYLLDPRVKHLIVYDQDIRSLIGKCRIKRMTGQFYEQRYEKKFIRLVQSKLHA